MSMVEMNGLRPPLTWPPVLLYGNQGATAKSAAAPVHKKDTTAMASISCANIDNKGRYQYNHIVEFYPHIKIE